MRVYYDMATDERLIHMVRSAERRRSWFWRINWWTVLGGLICTASAAVVVTGFTYAYIWASRWYR